LILLIAVKNKKMKKITKIIFLIAFLGLILSPLFLSTNVLAQSNYQPPTLIPAQDIDIGGAGGVCIGLATMIKTGNIHLNNLPCFIKYFTETLIGIAGSISVVFVMIGGYKYIVFSEQKKEEAQKTIIHALIGLAVSLLAWVLIDLVLQIATE